MASVADGTAARAVVLNASRSLALVACGTVWTRAWLLGSADGQARLLAHAQVPTTAESPQFDASLGIQEALLRLERATGRTLLTGHALLTAENEAGDGVDGLALLATVGGGLRILVGGPGCDTWAPLVVRSIATIDSLVQALPDISSSSTTAFTTTPFHLPPHVAVICGSAPGQSCSPDQFAATLAVARDRLGQETRVIVLGSSAEEQRARQEFAGHPVFGIDSEGAGLSPAPLAAALGQIYDQVVLGNVPGLRRAREWSPVMPLSTTTALSRLVRFLAQRYGSHILAVDVGATGSLAVGANPLGSLVMTRVALGGVRRGAGAVLRHVGAERLARWLPEDLPEDLVQTAILTRMLHSTLLPTTRADLAFDHALTREALAMLAEEGTRPGGVGGLERIDVLLGTGGVLSHVATPSQAALMLLDGMQPTGMTSLILDVAGLAAPLGAASMISPGAAAQVADVDALIMQLGLCVTAIGSPPEGEPALRAILHYADGRAHMAAVMPGTIERLPLAPGQRAMLTLSPSPGVDIGLGPGRRARLESPVEGGRLGIIIDARGRPLVLPEDRGQRLARLREWQAALGG